MEKSELLVLLEQVLKRIEIDGLVPKREFQLSILLTLKYLLERTE